MATAHPTENNSFSACHSLDAASRFALQLEKISCSFGDTPYVDPSRLLGFFVLVDEFQPPIGRHAAETFTYRCQVAGVLAGSPSIGIADQLLVRVDGDDRDQLVPVSNLTVRAIEPPNTEAFPS